MGVVRAIHVVQQVPDIQYSICAVATVSREQSPMGPYTTSGGYIYSNAHPRRASDYSCGRLLWNRLVSTIVNLVRVFHYARRMPTAQ